MKKERKEKKDLSFLEKFKSDKKYKAKVELVGYGVFILILVLYLNIASAGSSSVNYQDSINDEKTNNTTDEKTASSEIDILFNNDINYEYEVNLSFKTKEEEEKNLIYKGKKYSDEMIIEKNFNEDVVTYYKLGKEYYNTSMELLSVNDIYDNISYEYIELDSVLSNLKLASLDHITDYSSGKKEYVYHLSIRDILNKDTGDLKIEYSVEIDNDIFDIKVDYSNLYKELDSDIISLEVEYIYKNINKIEELNLKNN